MYALLRAMMKLSSRKYAIQFGTLLSTMTVVSPKKECNVKRSEIGECFLITVDVFHLAFSLSVNRDTLWKKRFTAIVLAGIH